MKVDSFVHLACSTMSLVDKPTLFAFEDESDLVEWALNKSEIPDFLIVSFNHLATVEGVTEWCGFTRLNNNHDLSMLSSHFRHICVCFI